MPTKRKPAPANEAEAYELQLHIDNTARLYNFKREIERSLLRKVKSGKYNHALAPKAFLYVVDEGARDYRKENRMVGGFNPATRLMVAKSFVRHFEGEEEFSDAGGKRVANPSRKRKASMRVGSRVKVRRTRSGKSVLAYGDVVAVRGDGYIAVAFSKGGGASYYAPSSVLPVKRR